MMMVLALACFFSVFVVGQEVEWDPNDSRNVVSEGVGAGRQINRDDNEGGSSFPCSFVVGG